MNNAAAAPTVARAFALLCLVAAWTAYMPLGLKYFAYLGLGVLAAWWVASHMMLPAVLRWPPMSLLLALCLMLMVSAAWSGAPSADIASHVWHYSRALFMPLIAWACPPDAARRGLRHFAVASALVAVLTVVHALHLLPDSEVWSSTVTSIGNQRIVTSLLLALGVVLALIESADASATRAHRLAWLCTACISALGLAMQDRRTGMIALPPLLVVLAIASQRSWRRSAATLAGMVLLAALVWHQADGVRARFAEGLAELRAYEPTGVVATSWGMRVRMAELTLDMVRDAPLFGHGLGSWVSEWQSRAQGGSLLEGQRSPHNEYLLIAAQAGLGALALWLGVLAAALLDAWRAGRRGAAALMVWTAIAWSALFNVVIRDATFGTPLLLLAGLAMAASRQGTRSSDDH